MSQKRPHYDLITAWANGAEIQYRSPGNTWENIDNPGFFENTKYRLKPIIQPVRYRRYVACMPRNGYLVRVVNECDGSLVPTGDHLGEVERMPSFYEWIDLEWQTVEVSIPPTILPSNTNETIAS